MQPTAVYVKKKHIVVKTVVFQAKTKASLQLKKKFVSTLKSGEANRENTPVRPDIVEGIVDLYVLGEEGDDVVQIVPMALLQLTLCPTIKHIFS